NLGGARSSRARPHGDISGAGRRGFRRFAAQTRPPDGSEIGATQERRRDCAAQENEAKPARIRQATNTAVILRRPVAWANGRLEGWKQAPCLWPSFETLVRLRRARSSG